MRIAFITVGDPRRLTGGYLYHAQVFAGLRAEGLRVDEIVASGAGLAEQRAAAERFDASFLPELYDVIVVDALARGVCAPGLDRWRALRPVVVLVHQLPSIAEAEPAQVALEETLEALLLRGDRLIAVSRHGRAMLLDRGVPAERIAVVSPGFDRLPLAAGARRPVRDRAAVRALCVAQWIPRKGITTLIAAWAVGQWPGARLELIGETGADPAYAAEVRAAIAARPDAAIIVRGVVSDAALRAAYQAADLFVLPSRFEGYGMAYAEALAHGLPVVACDAGPVPELITSAAGLFVPPDDPQALAAALDRLIGNAALRRELGLGALRRAAELPSWADAVREFRWVLTSVSHPTLSRMRSRS